VDNGAALSANRYRGRCRENAEVRFDAIIAAMGRSYRYPVRL